MMKAASGRGWTVYMVTESLDEYLIIDGGKVSKRSYGAITKMLSKLLHTLRIRIHSSPIPSGEYQFYEQVYDPSWVIRGAAVAFRNGIRVFQGEFPGCALAAQKLSALFKGRSLTSLHNIEYLRIKEIYPALAADAIGWLKNMEIASCQNAQTVIVVSESDRAHCETDGIKSEKLLCIPNGIELRSYREKIPVLVRNILQLPPHSTVLVFHGGYSYPPNLEAVQAIAENILPHLPSHVYLYAIGSHPPKETLHKRIFFTGAVDDIAAHLLGCDVAIVPLLQGGGTRLKILEYFAAHVPVIATSKAVEGLDIYNEKELIICDDFSDYPAWVEKLSTDVPFRSALTKNAYEFTQTRDWDRVVSPWLERLEDTPS